MDKKLIAQIFNIWAKEYADNPEKFSAILDANGQPIQTYGDDCADTFERIRLEITLGIKGKPVFQTGGNL